MQKNAKCSMFNVHCSMKFRIFAGVLKEITLNYTTL